MIGKYVTVRRPKVELTVADILRAHWADYRKQYPVTPQQAKVVGSVLACRTPQLGGRIDECGECGALVFRFNSCRDRHCNQCQKFERAKWVQKQKVMQLPIPYFHIVFTTDHGLNPLFRDNQRLLYDLLFRVVKESLQEMAAEKLGCELGITAVLHTWGQKLDEHIHIHCVVTGGGLALDGSRWVRPAHRRYLYDVVELSARYRERLLAGIERLWQQGKLKLIGQAAKLDVAGVLAELRVKKWEVFAKPFNEPEAVTEYLSRYVHQVALSNYRLLSLKRGRVRFRYYDNRERAEVGGKGKEKELNLTAVEFIRRWLSHLLPWRYHRIRYFGLHHAQARREKLPRCRSFWGLPLALPVIEALSLMAWLKEILGDQVDTCPRCGAEGSLFKRAEVAQFGWAVRLGLRLLGQSTPQGVCA